jgi:hypothetical protein
MIPAGYLPGIKEKQVKNTGEYLEKRNAHGCWLLKDCKVSCGDIRENKVAKVFSERQNSN